MQGLLEHLNINTVLAGLFVLAMVYVLARALVIPAKFALRVGVIAVSGALLLLVSNVLLQAVDVFVPINPFTVLLTGYLGPPGLLALYLIQWFLAF
jgi:inhibitor of the pro-sigma K processing machinery